MDNQKDYESDIKAMRNTLASFVELLKKFEVRIQAIETALQAGSLVHSDEAMRARFTEGNKTNRTVNAPPKIIALALHLYHAKRVPASHIINSKLLSHSKMYGLTQWDRQYAHDYCEIHNVLNIYQQGFEADDFSELNIDRELFEKYL